MRTDGQASHYVLHSAVKGGNLAVARVLLDAVADVDAEESERFNNERGYNRRMKQTSFHIACAKGDLAMVALLLARGADANRVREDLEQVEREREEGEADT